MKLLMNHRHRFSLMLAIFACVLVSTSWGSNTVAINIKSYSMVDSRPHWYHITEMDSIPEKVIVDGLESYAQESSRTVVLELGQVYTVETSLGDLSGISQGTHILSIHFEAPPGYTVYMGGFESSVFNVETDGTYGAAFDIQVTRVFDGEVGQPPNQLNNPMKLFSLNALLLIFSTILIYGSEGEIASQIEEVQNVTALEVTDETEWSVLFDEHWGEVDVRLSVRGLVLQLLPDGDFFISNGNTSLWSSAGSGQWQLESSGLIEVRERNEVVPLTVVIGPPSVLKEWRSEHVKDAEFEYVLIVLETEEVQIAGQGFFEILIRGVADSPTSGEIDDIRGNYQRWEEERSRILTMMQAKPGEFQNFAEVHEALSNVDIELLYQLPGGRMAQVSKQPGSRPTPLITSANAMSKYVIRLSKEEE